MQTLQGPTYVTGPLEVNDQLPTDDIAFGFFCYFCLNFSANLLTWIFPHAEYKYDNRFTRRSHGTVTIAIRAVEKQIEEQFLRRNPMRSVLKAETSRKVKEISLWVQAFMLFVVFAIIFMFFSLYTSVY
ncbi:hypothetical protein Y032_0024g1052 [Ancylostoma ceylanicum]|uniref:Uncharacterized protein n=1 Tax=Ancylostoma ceylanicum TaxID=53326 RepID=A0A016UVY5_9BILA|nr:hypothetical protein Y032_0024g1052 [Ancylostoma ceylanicum]